MQSNVFLYNAIFPDFAITGQFWRNLKLPDSKAQTQTFNNYGRMLSKMENSTNFENSFLHEAQTFSWGYLGVEHENFLEF